MDQVPAPFCQSLAQIQKTGECVLAMKSGSLIYTSRNDLATQAIQIDADYVMWFDSDMVFKPDTMVRMLDTMQKNDIDILTGLYFRRVPPYSPVLFDKLEMRGEACLWSEFKTIPEGLFEVAGCGFGGVLMKTDCLLDIAAKEGGGVWFTPFIDAGEDCAFCVRARQNGYRIFCDPSIEFGHMGYAAVTRSLYEITKSQEAKTNGID